ncbi:hypothetical protein DSO57_1023990 [Entomophthora muscae]|uniref:Uncharacterized protein n=1 Tax=Entomophthora muscae TaxID=34485 RepID=A0ACC2TQ77_9FUNG|nr:hypothetical protein DSO57_1023990 [Entomophthora muscae]
MTDRGHEFIGNEFIRLLKDWYRPTEGLAPAEVQVHGGNARLVIGKLLEEFALMQAQYKLLASQHHLLVNDNSSKPVLGYDPGHTLGTGDQEPHTYSSQTPPIWSQFLVPTLEESLINLDYLLAWYHIHCNQLVISQSELAKLDVPTFPESLVLTNSTHSANSSKSEVPEKINPKCSSPPDSEVKTSTPTNQEASLLLFYYLLSLPVALRLSGVFEFLGFSANPNFEVCKKDIEDLLAASPSPTIVPGLSQVTQYELIYQHGHQKLVTQGFYATWTKYSLDNVKGIGAQDSGGIA